MNVNKVVIKILQRSWCSYTNRVRWVDSYKFRTARMRQNYENWLRIDKINAMKKGTVQF